MSKKTTGTPLQRLTAAIGRAKAEPSLSAAVMHLFDRYANGAPDSDEADAVVARLAQQHGITRETLAAFVADYKKVPQATRARVSSPELLTASATTPLSKVVRATPVLSRPVVAPAPTPKLTPRRPPLANLGRMVPRRRVPQLPWPRLRAVEEPAGSYTWGETITLQGHFPELTTAAAGTYRAFVEVMQLDNATRSTELTIVARATGELDVRLATAENGWAPQVWVTRTIEGETYSSNRLPLTLGNGMPDTPETLPTRIDAISPAGQYAGDRVVLRGLNLHTAPIEWVLMGAEEADPLLLSPTKLSASEVEVRLPRTMISGNYRVRCIGAFGRGVPSNVVDYTVTAHRFRIDLTRLQCVDETNPELGSDDIVTLWTVVGDNAVYGGTTGELGFAQDGARRDFAPGAYTIFARADAAPVRVNLYAHIKMFEWDAGEVAAAQQLVGFIGDLSRSLAPLLAEIPVAAIIATVVAMLSDVTSWILAWNGNDLIAEHGFSWTIEELLALTSNPSNSFDVAQQYYGDGGHYDLFFRVSRHR